MSSSITNGLCLRLPVSLSRIPAFVYGTAWKKDRSDHLVFQALQSGFTAVDTAAQPRHYNENLVGSALQRALEQKMLSREDIYVQTKYTPIGGQDPDTAPYRENDSVANQVRASVNSSLRNLCSTGGDEGKAGSYIDTVLLHSPLSTMADTLTAWATLEEFVPHQIRNLGISNIDLHSLEVIYGTVRVKPAVIQNRFYSSTKFDRGIRNFCVENNIIYQAFWTLTANPALLRSKELLSLSQKLEISREAALYCLVLGLPNVVVLNGTTNAERMLADTEAVKKCSSWANAEGTKAEWEDAIAGFTKLIGDKPK